MPVSPPRRVSNPSSSDPAPAADRNALRSELLQQGAANERKRGLLLDRELAMEEKKAKLMDEQIKQARIKTKHEALELWFKKRKFENELGESCPIDFDEHMS